MMKTTFRRGAALVAAGFMVAASAGTASADERNQPEYWENVLTGEGFQNVDCEKVEDDYDDKTWQADKDYLAVILKAGSDQSTDGQANQRFDNVAAGTVLQHGTGKDISHVIACVGDAPEEETEEPTTPPGDDDDEETEQPTTPPGDDDGGDDDNGDDDGGDDDKPTTPAPGDKPGEKPGDKPGQPTEPVKPGQPGDDAGKPVGPVVQTDVPAKGVNPAAPLTALAAAAGLGLVAAGVRRRGQEG